MKKIFCCCFMFFVFAISIFLPNLTLKEVVGIEAENYKLCSTTGSGVMANKLGFTASDFKVIKNECDSVIGEMIELNGGFFDLDKIVDKLGLLITEKQNLNSCTIINGFSKLIPYSNKDDIYNVQIKVSENKILIASPKFINF